MNLVKTAFLTTAIAFASTVHALEVTGMNDVKSADNGIAARLAAIVAVVNSLKEKLDDLETLVNTFASRITATETNISAIKNNGANNEVQVWNPKLETRLDAIETNITSIKGNGANNEVNAWNPKLETRLDAAEALNTTQNTRITKLEGNSGGKVVFGTCNEMIIDGYSGPHSIICPAGAVMTGLTQRGVNTGRKVWHASVRCCKVSVQ